MGSRRGSGRGLTVRDALGATTLAGARVLAGSRGLDRVVERMNVMEVPDILPWVKPREFLLTTAYPLRESPGRLAGLVGDLDARGLSGLGIKVGRYIDAIPDDMLALAEERGFPIVRLPDGVGFDDILNEVLTDILNLQAAALARSDHIHRALVQIVLSGGGLDEIARDLAALLDAAVLVCDPDGALVASSDLQRGQGTLRRTGLLAGERQVLLTEEDVPGCLRVAVSAGTRLHGHILAVADRRQLDADDLLALENAATVAALAITKSAAVAAVEGRYRSELLHDLLGGRIRSAGEAVSRAAALGWDIDRPVVVLVVTCERAEPDDRSGLLDRLCHALDDAARARDPGAATVACSGEVVLITGPPDAGAEAGAGATQPARELAQVLLRSARTATGLPLRAGVSRVAATALDVPVAHEQAVTAERIGSEGLTHFDDLGASRLLSLIPDRAELDRYVTDVLGPLAADDAATVDLRVTLETVLAHNLNIAESARRLHFHYNTLRYRVDKLERLLGPFTTDPTLRLTVELALQALRLRRGTRPHHSSRCALD